MPRLDGPPVLQVGRHLHRLPISTWKAGNLHLVPVLSTSRSYLQPFVLTSIFIVYTLAKFDTALKVCLLRIWQNLELKLQISFAIGHIFIIANGNTLNKQSIHLVRLNKSKARNQNDQAYIFLGRIASTRSSLRIA